VSDADKQHLDPALRQALIREWANGYAVGRADLAPSLFGSSMTQTSVHAALLGTRRDWVRDLGIATLAGLFLGLTGPFGSYLNGAPLIRLAYWLCALWIGLPIQGALVRVALALARRWRTSEVLLLAAAAILAAIPIAVLCRIGAVSLWGAPIERIGIAEWYGQTLLIAAFFAIGHTLLNRFRLRILNRHAETIPDRLAAVPVPEPVDFRARLPPDLGRDILALQMEDHYVRAHTSHGSVLILLPLHRAIEELGAPGLRIHRSWWVARHAIAGCVRDGRNLRLRLSNGLEAPVARASVAAVRAEGLLGPAKI
jgi:hypothetical protein